MLHSDAMNAEFLPPSDNIRLVTAYLVTGQSFTDQPPFTFLKYLNGAFPQDLIVSDPFIVQCALLRLVALEKGPEDIGAILRGNKTGLERLLHPAVSSVYQQPDNIRLLRATVLNLHRVVSAFPFFAWYIGEYWPTKSSRYGPGGKPRLDRRGIQSERAPTYAGYALSQMRLERYNFVQKFEIYLPEFTTSPNADGIASVEGSSGSCYILRVDPTPQNRNG